jgi:hypothetical protein
MGFNVEQVLQQHFVRALTRRICGDDPDVIERPAAFVLRRKDEGDDRYLRRLILLPPHGYTANDRQEACSHDEAESAKIAIQGAIREGKRGFSKIKDCLLIAAFNRSSRVSALDEPYLTFSLDGQDSELKLVRHSAGEPPFHVVKPNGEGFYHNLINLSDDWLLLQLDKTLRPQKQVDLAPHLRPMQDEHARLLSQLYEAVVAQGDGIFRTQLALVNAVTALPSAITLPALGEMLHVHDTGRHEACSVFAIILKVGKAQPDVVLNYLSNAREGGSIPAYYADQLTAKIGQRYRSITPDGP